MKATFSHQGGMINAGVMWRQVSSYLHAMGRRGYMLEGEEETQWGHAGPVELVLILDRIPDRMMHWCLRRARRGQ